MKKVLIVLGILIVIIAVAALSYLSYMGAFATVKIVEKEMGPFYFVYEPYKGDYAKVGPVMDKVYNRLASEFNIKPIRGMGIYYSDPKTTKPADLKSEVGFLLERSDALQADVIMKKMKVRIMFPKKYITAEFPMKNKMSIIIGIMKAYPKLGEYMKANGYKPVPSIEIYEKDRIIYAFEIKK